MLGKKMMIDLIDRKKLLDELGVYPTDMSDDDYDFVERLINSQQTIIPINHAHWNDDFSFKSNAKRVDICSCCKSTIYRDIDSDKYNYCPTCGAKMDEEVDKNE